MDVAAARRELTEAMEKAAASRGRDAALRAGRQVLARHCLTALGISVESQPSIATVIQRVAEAPAGSERRDCAVLLVHALAVRGLVPIADVRPLVEDALRSVLLRAEYPFAGSTQEKHAVLDRLHAGIDQLLQPLEPTFPNWQGLYAG